MTVQQTSDASQLKHIGFILDGNRRWAREQDLPTLEGHRQGYANLKTIAKAAMKEHGIPYVSAYIFSTENWKRTAEEVKYLMDLALWIATNELKILHEENIRVRFLGARDKLSAKLIKALEKAETLTQDNTGGTLGLCFNYGGQQEIAHAVQAAAAAGHDMQAITPEIISQYVYAPEIPPLDLIVRTSGEQRISNFMLWRASYSELLFVTKHWPAFTTDDLVDVIDEYASRQRRFGH